MAAQRPLYLLDANISYRFAVPFKALGYDMTSVADVCLKGQLRLQGKKSAQDPDIIEWMGGQQTIHGRRGVWITADWEASKVHAKLILANSICVFWICDPRNHALQAIQELQVLVMLIEQADDILTKATCPIYLRGTMDPNRKTKLWKLASHLMAPKLKWERVLY